MLGNLRRNLFWLLDLAKGGQVAFHYKEIKKLQEVLGWQKRILWTQYEYYFLIKS